MMDLAEICIVNTLHGDERGDKRVAKPSVGSAVKNPGANIVVRGYASGAAGSCRAPGRVASRHRLRRELTDLLGPWLTDIPTAFSGVGSPSEYVKVQDGPAAACMPSHYPARSAQTNQPDEI